MIFNLLGDVTGIYDGEGRKQAGYGYDAWGRQLWVRDAGGMEITDGGHVGRVNPMRRWGCIIWRAGNMTRRLEGL